MASVPWELIAKSQGLDGVIDDETRLRALKTFHCAIENDRIRYEEESQPKPLEEQVELVKSEFNQMQVNEDATIKGGWTDAEVTDDVPGKNAFCSGGKDCPLKDVPQRRNELIPIVKVTDDELFGKHLVADWQGIFNAYCQSCVGHYVPDIKFRNPNNFKNRCKRQWNNLINERIVKAKTTRQLTFQSMLECLDRHLAKENVQGLSKSEKYNLLRSRTVAFQAATKTGKETCSLAEQARRTEVARQYLAQLEDICNARDVTQVKMPSGITLPAHEAQYLTQFTRQIYVCFLCRSCKWFGRNDHWAASVSGGRFRCCNCGIVYRPWQEKSYGKGNMVICVRVRDDWHYIPTYWPESKEWNFVLKMMEATSLSDESNPASVLRAPNGNIVLDLAKYLANMHKLPGLQPFTMTDDAKRLIMNSAEWNVESFAHLEGPGKIQGMILSDSDFPTDDQLFVNWEEFCAAYANAQVEHINLQKAAL